MGLYAIKLSVEVSAVLRSDAEYTMSFVMEVSKSKGGFQYQFICLI